MSSAHSPCKTGSVPTSPHTPPRPAAAPRSGPVGRLSSSSGGRQNRDFSVTRGSGLGDGRTGSSVAAGAAPVPCPWAGGWRAWRPGSQLWPLIAGPSFSRLFSLQVPVPPKLFLSLVYKLEGTSEVRVALELTTGDAGSCHVGGISALNGERTELAPGCLPGLFLLGTLCGGGIQKVAVLGAGVGSARHPPLGGRTALLWPSSGRGVGSQPPAGRGIKREDTQGSGRGQEAAYLPPLCPVGEAACAGGHGGLAPRAPLRDSWCGFSSSSSPVSFPSRNQLQAQTPTPAGAPHQAGQVGGPLWPAARRGLGPAVSPSPSCPGPHRGRPHWWGLEVCEGPC